MRKRATATTIVHENIEFRKPPANERVPFGVPIGELGEDISLEDALEYAQEEAIHIDAPALSHASSSSQTANCDGGTQLRDVLSIDESNLLHWHFANLEYGCAGELRHVSNTWWDQDDADGGFMVIMLCSHQDMVN